MLPLLWMIAMEGRMTVEINREDETGWFVGLLDWLGLNSGRNTEKITLSSEADKSIICVIFNRKAQQNEN